MARLIPMALIVFLAALVGGMSASVISAGHAAVVTDSTVASDSSHADSTASTAHGDAAPPATPPGALPVADSTSFAVGSPMMVAVDVTPAAATPPVAVAADSTAAPAVPAAASRPRAPGDTSLVPTERRLAKVFAAMAPREAARVLEQMNDTDVELLLGYLSERQAAVILSSFPPQRAARIGQNALRGKRTP